MQPDNPVPPIVPQSAQPIIGSIPQPVSQAAPMSIPQPIPQRVPIASPVAASQVIYASFWRRFGAALIDGVIVYFIGFVIGFVIGFIAGFTGNSAKTGIFNTLNILISLLIGEFYYIYLIGKFGQTLGKKWLRVKVIKIGTDEVPGYFKAFLRDGVGKILSAIILLLGYFWMLWDSQKQTWHDKIAGTIVVKI